MERNAYARELPYAAATVRRIVVCTFGRFTTGHTQAKAHACMCAPKYYDLKWHEFVFYATRPLHAGEQDAVGCIVCACTMATASCWCVLFLR
jgi:hypothetical protein